MKKIIVFIFLIIFISCSNQNHFIKKSEKTKKIIKLENLSNNLLNYLISELQIANFNNIDLKIEIETIDYEKLEKRGVKIKEWDNINSWFGYPDRIYIGENLFKLVKNEAELAAIICHELGHFYYTHAFSGFDLEIESKADLFAVKCLKKSNYNINSLKNIFEKLFKIFIKGYPTLEKVFLKRIEKINLYIEEMKKDGNGKLFIVYTEREFKNIVNPIK